MKKIHTIEYNEGFYFHIGDNYYKLLYQIYNNYMCRVINPQGKPLGRTTLHISRISSYFRVKSENLPYYKESGKSYRSCYGDCLILDKVCEDHYLILYGWGNKAVVPVWKIHEKLPSQKP